MKKITITINGKKCECHEGDSVLQAAVKNKIDIPHFCYHEDLPIDANCRTCLVESEGYVTTSCTLKATDGMKVSSETNEVKKQRNKNLELLLAKHFELCPKCKKGYYCKTAVTMKKYKITGKKYSRPTIKLPIHKMGSAAEFDPNQCISCNKCVEMCEKIGVCFLKLEGKGAQTHLTYNKDPRVDCIYCGQCTVHCPVAAVREQGHIERVEKVLKDKSKIVIAQMAPSVRCSIGEEFGVKAGANLEGECCTAFRMLGFDKVFDVNMGADITTWVEAEELVHRIKNKGVLPMFTSCCPGWVKFAEFYFPDMLDHLTTARSPQIHSGGAYKTWWADKMGIDPKNIVVVSLMPCTSKKYETYHKKLWIDGMKPVDHVLTTREFAILLKKNNIDLPNLKKSGVDEYGTYSGAGAIYGATGGVMESALRTAHYMITGKELAPIKYENVRGMDYIKRAEVVMGGKKIKVAVAAMAKNARTVINEIKRNPDAYHYVEFMACPGGCIGGGGQPIPSTEAIIWDRIKGLYRIDDKMKLRRAHQNPVVKDFMENYIAKLPHKRQEEILHTHYRKRKKFE
jgi:NADH-quinone oxidoreductase subunit G/NADP-reducing hydrogenase subunit HndD